MPHPRGFHPGFSFSCRIISGTWEKWEKWENRERGWEGHREKAELTAPQEPPSCGEGSGKGRKGQHPAGQIIPNGTSVPAGISVCFLLEFLVFSCCNLWLFPPGVCDYFLLEFAPIWDKSPTFNSPLCQELRMITGCHRMSQDDHRVILVDHRVVTG